jgi:hypothetical protein
MFYACAGFGMGWDGLCICAAGHGLVWSWAGNGLGMSAARLVIC